MMARPMDEQVEETAMDTSHKLDILTDVYTDKAQLDSILDKLLDATLSQYRLRLKRYEQDLAAFEKQYSMKSAAFYERFEAGELGDAMDFFEWAGLYELAQDLTAKAQHLEAAL
jgi:hypothetical protein